MIIAIEGCDASGKKTQSKALAAGLGNARTAVLSFPRYDGPFGDIILRCLHRESVMYRADKTSAIPEYKYNAEDDAAALRGLFALDQYAAADEIKWLHEAGHVVILDRYWPSNVCYGVEDGFDMGVLRSISSSLPQADIYFYIDVSIEEAAKRRPIPRDRYERDKEKLARVRDRYLDLWKVEGKGGVGMLGDSVSLTPPLWIVIDGHQKQEEVTEQMLGWVRLFTTVSAAREQRALYRYLPEWGPAVQEAVKDHLTRCTKQKR